VTVAGWGRLSNASTTISNRLYYARNLRSISSMFCEQFLQAQNPKSAKKRLFVCLFALLVSARVKAACRMLVKLKP